MAVYPTFHRAMPDALLGIDDIARDLRWSGSEVAASLWSRLDEALWEQTGNPIIVLEHVPDQRLAEAANDPQFIEHFKAVQTHRENALASPERFQNQYGESAKTAIAYFSMEFGLSESLPLYAGGLGILAGDHLKASSDMGVPLFGIGLLYDQGYFEQVLTPDGWQVEAYPYNDPSGLPVAPALASEGGWLTVSIDLPGRALMLRVWTVRVGNVTLYLLDANHPLNSPWDRAITDKLYPGPSERRLLQELILGYGGWRLIEALGEPMPDVCHLNEGHAAFVVLARAQAYMRLNKTSFNAALFATRAGNIFTTHTPVPAGFDRFDPGLLRRYLEPLAPDVPLEEVLALGSESGGSFNMAYFATRGSGAVSGVSRLHGEVSKEVLSPLFPRWPLSEVPVGYVTNAVHVDSWAGPQTTRLWSRPDGDDTWSTVAEDEPQLTASDRQLFDARNVGREHMINYVRKRLERQCRQMAGSDEEIRRCADVLDTRTLTLGFARRFAAYKRPNLLLDDIERLSRLLNNAERPVQLIVAGKAHPGDNGGKALVQRMVKASLRPDLSHRLVFLSDYDMALTRHLAAGVDVWINTPRRPMEASGTSGMKLLVNGGLNLSELDGWWAEAYDPAVGWALGDGQEHTGENIDGIESNQLYDILEQQVVPEFYDRGDDGLPSKWLARVKASMSRLTPQFSTKRMLREYVETLYLPAAKRYRVRTANGPQAANDLQAWQDRLTAAWSGVHFGEVQVEPLEGGESEVSSLVWRNGLSAEDVRVELYAEGIGGGESERIEMRPDAGEDGGGAACYRAKIYGRPVSDYTPRIVAARHDVAIPLEAAFITWQR